MINAANIDYKAEIARKAIHFCSLSIPVIYYFIERDLALMILVPITLGFLAVDLLRYYHAPTSALFYSIFSFMLRKHEQDPNSKRLNGATNVLIAASICVIIFPKFIVLTAFPILIISDSVAALFGRRFGKRKFMQKSLEGSGAFFASALLVIYFTPKIDHALTEYAIGAAAALVGTVAEAGSWKIDDNLSIPLSVGAVMWGLYIVLYPSIDLHALVIH